MTAVNHFIANPKFRKQAREFAKWYGLERRAVFELGKIAAGWLRHYSRTRNAERLADALYSVTGLRITGRSILHYRDIYLLDKSWRGSGKAKSRNDFKIRHVAPGHLRVVATSKLPDFRKHQLLDEVERKRLTVKQTTGRARQYEIQYNRSKRTYRLRQGDSRVVRGDAIDVIKRLKRGSIHHLFADWQWENTGTGRECYQATPVHRESDPAEYLCQFLETACPYLNKNGILWIFSKTTAFSGGEIGLPHEAQKTAHRLGLNYCSEFVFQHTVAGHRSKNTFLAVKHTPLYPFVLDGFDYAPVTFAPSVSKPLTSPNHVSQLKAGVEKHPYQKPVELFANLLEMGTPGGLVFDAFAGSGAAGVAAVNAGYPYFGAEIQPAYVRMANRAIAAAIGEQNQGVRSA